jgi:hypothetical protein
VPGLQTRFHNSQIPFPLYGATCRRSSPESQRSASDLIGSEASVLISITVHFKHSNLRCSKPSGPSETAVVIIRL